MQALLSLILGVLALVSGMYFTKEYGTRSPALISSAISMLLAIIIAFNGGEQHGRSRQQEDINEALDKQMKIVNLKLKEFQMKESCDEHLSNSRASR